MKPNVKEIPPRRITTIDCDFKNRNVICDVNIEGVDTPFQQVFNLDVVPFDVAMSVICDMLTPRKPNGR